MLNGSARIVAIHPRARARLDWLVLIVVIRPLGWRLLATLLLWIAGVAALILSSDGVDQAGTQSQAGISLQESSG